MLAIGLSGRREVSGLGDMDRAQREAQLLDDTLAGTGSFIELDLIETITRVQIAAGDAAGARERVTEAIAVAQRSDNPIMEASLLAVLVEAGGAADAVDRLAELAEVIEGELIKLKLAHARAEIAGEGHAAVADRYEELGFVVTAATVRAQA